MAFKELDVVVLKRDLPEHALRKGDVGTVVNVDPDESVLVEFVLASGDTEAIVHLRPSDLRSIDADDMHTVRPTGR